MAKWLLLQVAATESDEQPQKFWSKQVLPLR
jgi:hypothetical protein